MVKPPKYTLGDAVQLHRQHPETFALYPEEDREGLRVGDVAQLSFDVPGFKSERMWVLVIGRFRNKYIGTVNNAPIQASFPLSFGDKVTFSAKNIYQARQFPNWPELKNPEYLAQETELARRMASEQQQPTTNTCEHCGKHDAESMEHMHSVREVMLAKLEYKVFDEKMKEAWAQHDYTNVAHMGAGLGKRFMADQIGKVPNEELGFVPKFFVFDKDGNRRVFAFPELNGENIDRILPKLFAGEIEDTGNMFENFKPEGILLIAPTTFSKTAHKKLASITDPEAQKKEFQEHPPSSYPDKITASNASVYLAPDKIELETVLAVGTEAELAAAGFAKAQQQNAA